jgi:hypothetical protein
MTPEALKAKFEDSKYSVRYEDLVSLCGEILAEEMIGEYQGDHHCLVKNGKNYAHVVTGYGSCEMCDSLSACETADAVVELANALCEGAIWRSKEEMIKHIHEHDAKGSWYGSEMKSWKLFQQSALQALNSQE